MPVFLPLLKLGIVEMMSTVASFGFGDESSLCQMHYSLPYKKSMDIKCIASISKSVCVDFSFLFICNSQMW